MFYKIAFRKLFLMIGLLACFWNRPAIAFSPVESPTMMGQPTKHYILVKVPYEHRDTLRLISHGLYASHGTNVLSVGSWARISNKTVVIQNAKGVVTEHPVRFKTWVRNGTLFVEPMASEDEPEKIYRQITTQTGDKQDFNIISNRAFMMTAPMADFFIVNKKANYALPISSPIPIEAEKLEYEVEGPLEISIILDAPAREPECPSVEGE